MGKKKGRTKRSTKRALPNPPAKFEQNNVVLATQSQENIRRVFLRLEAHLAQERGEDVCVDLTPLSDPTTKVDG